VNDTAPEISFVIPCYNEEGNLHELIKAIRAETEAMRISYEILITDDCSTDKSWEILKEFSASDSRIRAQRLAANSGESAAQWAGMKAACGKYIVTLDADLQNHPRDLPRVIRSSKSFPRALPIGCGINYRGKISLTPGAAIAPSGGIVSRT